MKKLSLLDKLLFFVNSLLATLLILSYLTYFISPNSISLISIISLSVPFLILINLIFAIYWLIKLKKQFLLSLFVLLIGFPYLTKFYNISEKKILLESDTKIMSYNVRMFNKYKNIKEEGVDKKIIDFITNKQPDILCLQEYSNDKKSILKFPYRYTFSKKKSIFGQAIYTRYKILNKGSLNFSSPTNNNAIFVDILKGKDTIRIYNVHLQSLQINPQKEELTKENGEKLRKRVEKAFKIQANQIELLKLHMAKSNLKTIICGDFNNNAFSWAYHQLKENKNDAFEEAGKGFGKTYDFPFPFRIDFILTDESFPVNNFKTYPVKYSDHNPIMARISFNNN
ncbi:Metal-dependent hydrolase, endonuclease/exonuclease/phosphatase family [Lutibacter oricola]|uniref:Metal-dependent hydrolase, endonuclease/exonuclease/phosphatase family n=1 Tax=Lutibacter oricola TaxID=762486 RepID=A0A1H3EZX7_9FLAO|nr:endonuclease/exonuclease/phosphatase family protein [Lutibacter oricola]SDX84301.1 Metal-dependent hydrolase, endonuclease/exonuclease/phosphatase family [Lutibacter oricola]